MINYPDFTNIFNYQFKINVASLNTVIKFVYIIKVDNLEEADATANDTEFGLSSAICTRSLYYAREFKRLSEAGMAMVNLPTAGVDYHVPFGGRKNSSYGSREQGRAAIDFYTTTKTTYSFAG